MDLAYLDGAYTPLDRVRISPLDRGFLFGDGVYEVIPVYAGRAFRLAAHLARLERSLEATRIAVAQRRADWETLCRTLIDGNGGGDQLLYLQVTRGVAPRRHAFPDSVPATIFAMSRSPSPEAGGRRLTAVTADDNRWGRCDIKSICLLPNVLFRQQAAQSRAAEAILLRDGYVTEGAASNVFVVCDQAVRTPPEGAELLSGITRGLALELVPELGLELTQTPISEAALRGADEIWLTSSSMEISLVTELDGAPVGTAGSGPVWTQVSAAFADFKQRHRGS